MENQSTENLFCGYDIIRFCQVDAAEQPKENPNFIISTFYKESDYQHIVMNNEISSFTLDPEATFVYHTETTSTGEQDKKTARCSYMVKLWAFDENGTKHMSHETFLVYNIDSQSFDAYYPNIETSEETDETDETIKFSFSGLSVDEKTGLNMTVEVPIDYSECDIYINSKKISNTQYYRNSWLKVSSYTTEVLEETVKFSMNIDVEDNLPDVLKANATNTEDYNSNPGTSNKIEGCSLFNSIMKNENLNTESRTANVTVVYTKYGVEHRSHYTIEQPGYIEKRIIPKVNLKIDKELTKLEESNKLTNGVMCNQYQFFIDVDIEDFTREAWGSYVDEDSITLNFEITNATIDDDFIEKYAIYSTEETYTVHVNTVDNKTDNEDNYISIKTTVVDSTETDVYNTSQRQLDENYENLIDTTSDSNKLSISVSDTIYTSDPTTDIDYLRDGNKVIKTIVGTSSTMFENPYVRKTGVHNQTVVKFENIKFSEANKQFKIRVVVEYGNPMFSRLFFKYYVSDMYIKYTTKNEDGSILNNLFYIGKNNLHVSKTGTYSETEYMFSTETLNTFVCPVSFTTIPYDDSLTSIRGNVKLSGSDKQITLAMDKYCGKINSMLSDDELLREYVENQIVPWEQFKLKRRYLQDSTSSLSVKPIHISDYYDKISKYELFGATKTNNYTYDDVKSEENATNYMSVVYHSGYYNSMMRND